MKYRSLNDFPAHYNMSNKIADASKEVISLMHTRCVSDAEVECNGYYDGGVDDDFLHCTECGNYYPAKAERQVVATDHAAFTREQKRKEYLLDLLLEIL